jgi:FkbM family methyltransferase
VNAMGLRRATSQLRDTARVLDEAVRRFGVLDGVRATQAVRRAGRGPSGEVHLRVPGLPRPIALRSGTSDAATFVQIFLRGDLDFPVAAEPGVIVDGGANIGLSALYLHRRFPRARIVAVEFEASNFALLARNVAGYPDIVAVHAGLWPHDGLVAVANADAAKWAHFPRACGSADPAGPDGQPAATTQQTSVVVRAVSMPTLMAEQGVKHVDLLKLDIEGSELDLFDADPAWLDCVSTLAVELHERLRPGSSQRVMRAVARRATAASVSGEYLVCELEGSS